MKPKKKQKQLRITEADFMLANRRAARLEEIAGHGKPVSFRTALHKSKKVYDRKRLKRAGIHSDDCPSSFAAGADPVLPAGYEKNHRILRSDGSCEFVFA